MFYNVGILTDEQQAMLRLNSMLVGGAVGG